MGRVVAIALAVTSVLYLGLAVATIGVLGRNADTLVPLTGLLRAAVGPAGTAGAAVAAVVLTLGTTNAYLNGAAAMAGALIRPRRIVGHDAAGADAGPRTRRSTFALLAAIAACGLPLITLYGLGLASPASLIAVPTALFLAVYLGCMTAAARTLRGRARLAAVPASLAVLAMLGYCGWALIAPVAVAVATRVRTHPGVQSR
jgi:amino acid efflux transporter